MLYKYVHNVATHLQQLQLNNSDSLSQVISSYDFIEAMKLDEQDSYTPYLENHWREINSILKEVHGWESFQPQANERWVFWNITQLLNEINNLELTNDEAVMVDNALSHRTSNTLANFEAKETSIGNYNHVEKIANILEPDKNSGVSLATVLVIHSVLSVYLLDIGVTPLTYKQLHAMTGISHRQIPRSIDILEKAGLWVCLRGGKHDRTSSRFISLSTHKGVELAYSIIGK